jgi:hypothetical protein
MLRSRVAREDGDTSRVRPSDSKRWGRLPASAVSNQPHFMATTFYGRPHFYGRPVLVARHTHTHTARIHADTHTHTHTDTHTHTHSADTRRHTAYTDTQHTHIRTHTPSTECRDVFSQQHERVAKRRREAERAYDTVCDEFIGWNLCSFR